MLIYPDDYYTHFQFSDGSTLKKESPPVNTDFVMRIDLQTESVGSFGNVIDAYTIQFKINVSDYVKWYFNTEKARDTFYYNMSRKNPK
jgi:hypothetical protein